MDEVATAMTVSSKRGRRHIGRHCSGSGRILCLPNLCTELHNRPSLLNNTKGTLICYNNTAISCLKISRLEDIYELHSGRLLIP